MKSEAAKLSENIRQMRSRLSFCTALAIVIGLTLAATDARAKPRSSQAASPNNWLHFHRDNQITGWNPNETILTPATVASGNFGVVWESIPGECGGAEIPPHMYASPLFVEDVIMTTGDQYDGMHFSVVIAATNTNFVCAIAAADPTGMVSPGTVLWKRSIGAPSIVQLQDGIAKGIYGTPAIDLVSTPPRVYVVGDTDICEPPNLPCRVHRGYALDLGSGHVLDGWPLMFSNKTIGIFAPPGIQQNGPTVFRDVNRMDERGGLTLSLDNSILYVTFGSYPDQGPGFLQLGYAVSNVLESRFEFAELKVGPGTEHKCARNPLRKTVLFGLCYRLIGNRNCSSRISGDEIGARQKWKDVADAVRMAELFGISECSLGVRNAGFSVAGKSGRNSKIDLRGCLEVVCEDKSQWGMLLGIIKSNCVLQFVFRLGQFTKHEKGHAKHAVPHE